MRFVLSIELPHEAAEKCPEVAEKLRAIAKAIAAEGDVELWACVTPSYDDKPIRMAGQVIGTWRLEP